MECPQCGGECYDNRQKNQQRMANGDKPMPEFKCRDASCGWKKWPPKGQRSQGNGLGIGQRGPRVPLGPLYNNAMRIAAGVVKLHIGDKATPADVIAATATIFIAAANTGAPLQPPPKPKVEEPPPIEDDGGGGEGY